MDDRDMILPLEARVPPDVVASPTEMLRPAGGGEPRWYMPGWRETARLLGWRWVLFAPAAALVALLAWAPWRPELLHLLVGWWKVAVFAVALPAGVALNAAAHAIRSRRDPFCIHCGYGLTGLPEAHTCPECGEAYTHRLIAEYRRDPRWFVRRYRMAASLPRADAPFAAWQRTSARRRSRDGT